MFELRRLRLLHEFALRGTIAEVAQSLSYSPSTVSQQLARLRLEGLVATRREGKTIYYRIASDKVRAIIGAIYDTFCAAGPSRAA